MAKSTTRKDPFALFLTTLLVLVLTISKPAAAQNEPVSLEGTVTPEFFNSILSRQARPDCAGKGFYSHGAFIDAAKAYPSFGSPISKREIAAFFAHVSQETEFMCFIEEIDRTNNYCDLDPRYIDYPCAAGKGYYGRGPIQLTWNYNYGLCGKDLNEDLLASPEKVAQDPILAFKTAFWFWTTNVRGQFSQGFGATIKAINSMECGGNSPAAENRKTYFQEYCRMLGVEPGEGLSC